MKFQLLFLFFAIQVACGVALAQDSQDKRDEAESKSYIEANEAQKRESEARIESMKVTDSFLESVPRNLAIFAAVVIASSMGTYAWALRRQRSTFNQSLAQGIESLEIGREALKQGQEELALAREQTELLRQIKSALEKGAH
jgi:hypothetical protein